eukprot:591439-Pelagomonas_calceolata.AAC.3
MHTLRVQQQQQQHPEAHSHRHTSFCPSFPLSPPIHLPNKPTPMQGIAHAYLQAAMQGGLPSARRTLCTLHTGSTFGALHAAVAGAVCHLLPLAAPVSWRLPCRHPPLQQFLLLLRLAHWNPPTHQARARARLP